MHRDAGWGDWQIERVWLFDVQGSQNCQYSHGERTFSGRKNSACAAVNEIGFKRS